MNDFKELIETSDYNFLRENNLLGDNICLLTLGGSHAYGTNVEGSDVDIRGFSLETKNQILTGKTFDQVIDKNTDTVIYSFKKLIGLLTKCNPNIIEMLGCREQDYIFINDIGKKLLNNKHLFLSKSAFFTFSGYASAQMKRLNHCSTSITIDGRRNDTIVNAIENSLDNVLIDRETQLNDFSYDLILPGNDSDEKSLTTDSLISFNCNGLSLKDTYGVIGSIYNSVLNFTKESRHNSEAVKYNKMNKHMMHLIRLYMMVIDILKDGEIITYREGEHDLLMSIRNGDYLDNGVVKDEFFKIVKEYEEAAGEAFDESKLPRKANVKRIDEFLVDVYEEYLF